MVAAAGYPSASRVRDLDQRPLKRAAICGDVRSFSSRPLNDLGHFLDGCHDVLGVVEGSAPEPRVSFLPFEYCVDKCAACRHVEPVVVDEDSELVCLNLDWRPGGLRRDAPGPCKIAEILDRIAARYHVEIDHRDRQLVPKDRVIRAKVVVTNHRAISANFRTSGRIVKGSEQLGGRTNLVIGEMYPSLRHVTGQVGKDVSTYLIATEVAWRP